MKCMARKFLPLLLVLAMLFAMTACGTAASETTTSESAETEAETETEAAEESQASQDTDAEAETSGEEAQAEETEQAEEEAEAEPEAEEEAEAEETSSDDAEAAAEISYPLSDETVTLSLFFSVSPNLAAMMESMNDIAAYDAAEQATNVHLDATISTPETTGEKFNVMIASGEYTDLIHGVAQSYSGGLDKAVDDEVLLDLYPYISEYAPDYSQFLEENPTAKKLYTSESGYLPAIQGLSYSFVQGPIIRQDWLDDLGLTAPTTISELEEVLTAFKNEKGATNSILFTIGNIFVADAFNIGVDGTDGAAYEIVDGKVEICYFNENYYEFISTLARWYANGLYSDDFISLFGAGQADSFVLSDDCGFWTASQDNLGSTYAESYTGVSENFSTTPIPMVTYEEGDTVNTGTMIGTSGEAWSVTTSCADPELAVAYLNWFFTDEGNLVCNYGTENVSFVYDETGTPVYTDLIVNNPDGLSQMQAQWIYCNFQAPYVQDSSRNNSLYADEVQKNALTIWDSNRTDSMRYYGEMTTEESEEYSIYSTDLETYAGEQLLKFMLNQEPLNEDTWATFLDTLKEMGAETMQEIKQSAYERYLAK